MIKVVEVKSLSYSRMVVSNASATRPLTGFELVIT